MSSKTTNLNLTKPSEDEFYDINVQNENMDIIDREIGGLKQPAYEVPTAMSDLHSGEMITVAFGKIAKAVSTLISHTTSKATNSVLGHVKLSDSTSSTSASTAGVAATPKAVKAAYDLANSNTEKIGTTDISGIGDGTVTGAIVNNKEAIEDVSQSLTTKLSLSSFKVVTLGGNTNLNDISECGIYSVPGGLNAPYGDWSIMMVLPINGDANYVHQICFSLGRARPSARAYAYGSWTDWVEL